jgi:hypothetical protein
LLLQVTKSGAKSWIYRFTLNKKTRDMGLGPLQSVPLAAHHGSRPLIHGPRVKEMSRGP